jgi:hypothetical protein
MPRRTILCAIGSVLAAAAIATGNPPEPAMSAPHEPKSGGFIFTLLPKAFQKNPELEMTVFTEFTDAGRELPLPSPAHPAYYVLHVSGLQERGAPVVLSVFPPPAYLAQLLQRSLQANGYLPAPESSAAPSLALFYLWGAHMRLDPDLAAMFPALAGQHLIERARLVGGRTYQRQILNERLYGRTIFANSSKREYLDFQASNDLFYAVVSAYDFAALAKGQHRLLWRTYMTVNAQGVNMGESLPPLIVTAAPYFGRAMTEPGMIMRHVRRDSVIIGPMEVIETDVPLPTPAPAKSRKAK